MVQPVEPAHSPRASYDHLARTLADALIDAGVEVAAWVPDKRLAPIADRLAERGIPLRTLTREEECFGYAAGYRAAGGMPVVLAQCSGLGNSLNAIGSLVIPYGLAFPVVLSMRGTLGERNPAQMPLGRTTVAMLEALGVQSFPLRAPGRHGQGRQGRGRRRRRRARARPDPPRGRTGSLSMNPTDIVRTILDAAPGALVVPTLGTPTSALRAASDDGPHLYMGGSMGTALAAALGVAEKRPEREVLAILGDGEALMGANSLWTLAGIAPKNLLAIVLVDGHYSITGGQALGVPTCSVTWPRHSACRPPPHAPTTRSPNTSQTSRGRRYSRSATRSVSGLARRRSSTPPWCGGASSRPRGTILARG